MMSFSVPKARRACFRFAVGTAVLVTLQAFLFPAFLAAEITIEPHIGYQGIFQLGRPFPVDIDISNSGPSGEGALEIEIWKGGATKGGAPYPIHYRREVFLAAHARKTVQFTVDPDFVSRPLIVNFIGSAGKASRQLDLRGHFSPAPILLLITGGNTVPPVFLAPTSQNRVVALALNDLPADPRAWLGVSHLVLYDQSLRDLSRAQLFALDTWLTAGGKLVVLGSMNYALYQEPALSRLLPVRVTGTRRILWTPQPTGSEPAASIPDVWAQVSTLNGGKLLVDSNGLPLLVEAARGKGKIVYWALDIGRPPLAYWNGLPVLLGNLLAAGAVEDASPPTRWDDSVFSQLILSPAFSSAYIPTGSLLAAVTIYFGGIGIFAALWQRRRRSSRSLLAGFTIFVIGSAFAGYSFFSRGGNIPDGVLVAATVMENSVGGYAEAQTNLALFSTQIRPYNLDLERGWIDLTPVSAPLRDRSDTTVVLQDGVSSRYRLPLREWDYRLFRLRSVRRFAVRAEFASQGDKLLMTVDNQSAKDLIDCWLLLPGQRHALGELPSGARWNKVFSLAQTQEAAPGRSEGIDFRDVTFPDKAREILFHSSFFPRSGEPARWNGSALFFGWVKDPERNARVDDPRIRVHDFALFREIFPLAGAEDE
jgi:hypothetical protein